MLHSYPFYLIKLIKCMRLNSHNWKFVKQKCLHWQMKSFSIELKTVVFHRITIELKIVLHKVRWKCNFPLLFSLRKLGLFVMSRTLPWCKASCTIHNWVVEKAQHDYMWEVKTNANYSLMLWVSSSHMVAWRLKITNIFNIQQKKVLPVKKTSC